MKRLLPATPVAAAMCILAVIGCGRTTSPLSSALTSNDSDLGATPVEMASNALARDMQLADSIVHGPCGAIGFPLRIPSGCPYDAASLSFVCTDTGYDGLTRTLRYQSLTTSSIHIASHLSGTTTRNGHVSVVDATRDLTVSGLAGTETTRTWDGTASSSRQDSAGATTTTIQSTSTIAAVVVPAPWARDSWPLSGTITTHLVASNGVDQTAVITFNGTQFVPLTINGTTVTIDLARWLHGGLGRPRGGGGPIAGGPRGGPRPGPGHH